MPFLFLSPGIPPLPVDPSLANQGGLAPLMSAAALDPTSSSSGTSTVVVTEGIPPVSRQLVDKIRRWEYVNLADLLKDPHSREQQGAAANNQVMTASRLNTKQFLSINNWLRAYNILSAVLLSSEDTSKEEAAGLAAYSYLILQLSEDLQGIQWSLYDKSYREWASAKGVRRWGEMNLSIYGRCLASNQGQITRPIIGSKRKAELQVCYRWNEGQPCSKSSCKFAHRCRACGGGHRAMDCSTSQGG